MHGLNNLKTRLNYRGGIDAESRIQKDKEKSLEKALLYSYQAETIALSDGRIFRCLINSDRTKADYDCKIISIPYSDICYYRLNEQDEIIKNNNPKNEEIGLKCGDIFKWLETDTYWITYLERLEEDSYFRAEIYRCEEEVEINGNRYHIYVRGPVETTVQWNQKKGINWNDINYSLIIFITKNEETLDYFHRFVKIKVGGKTWDVVAVDPYSADGIIQIGLAEWYENSMEKYSKINDPYERPQTSPFEPYIEGNNVVYPFDIHEYTIKGINSGKWKISNSNAKILKIHGDTVKIEITSGVSGKFNLIYEIDKENKVILPIKIKSI